MSYDFGIRFGCSKGGMSALPLKRLTLKFLAPCGHLKLKDQNPKDLNPKDLKLKDLDYISHVFNF